MSEYTIITLHGSNADNISVSVGAFCAPPVYGDDDSVIEPGETIEQAYQRAVETADRLGITLGTSTVGQLPVDTDAESFKIKIIDTLAVRERSLQDKATGEWYNVSVIDFYHKWNNGYGEYCEFSAYMNDDVYINAFDEAMKPLGITFEDISAKKYASDNAFVRSWNNGNPTPRPQEIKLERPIVFMPDNPERNSGGRINFINLVADVDYVQWPTAAWSKPTLNRDTGEPVMDTRTGEPRLTIKYQPRWYNDLRGNRS